LGALQNASRTRIFAPAFEDYIDILHTPNILLKEIIFACYINQKFQNKSSHFCLIRCLGLKKYGL
jgi:hypothetical protein